MGLSARARYRGGHGWVGDEKAEQFGQRREGTGAWFAYPGQASVPGFRLSFGQFTYALVVLGP